MQAIFKNFGIYLHVPFCAQNCDYCRFYKRAPASGDFSLYLETIASELKLHASENGGSLPRVDTLFWGGGTPSVLPEPHLMRLCEIFSGFLKPESEWTVEVAPTSASAQKLKILKDFGVTRISMGVQSFNPQTLASLGRRHTLKATMDAIERVAETGFKNFCFPSLPKFSLSNKHKINNIPITIGLTATPIRYLDNGKDMRYLFDKVIEGLTLEDAVEQGIVKPFEKYVTSYFMNILNEKDKERINEISKTPKGKIIEENMSIEKIIKNNCHDYSKRKWILDRCGSGS